jgi:anaphase-promoting complex subunit 3
VFAQACLGLERNADGIAALERARGLWGGRNCWSELDFGSGRFLDETVLEWNRTLG